MARPGLACGCFGVPQRRPASCCLEIPEDRLKRPDPAIYSQEEQIAAGREPTWNNPDIVTVYFPYERLSDETSITVRNLSPDTAALGAQVHVSMCPFGIGFEWRRAGSLTVSLAAAASAELSFPWSRAVVAGDPRIGVHIEIEHPADRNRTNNSGSQILAVSLTSVLGRTLRLDIPVLNRSSFTRRFTFRVLTDDIVAAVEPASRSFSPHEENMVSLRVEVPASVRATSDRRTLRYATVIATADDGTLVGGVTQSIVVDG